MVLSGRQNSKKLEFAYKITRKPPQVTRKNKNCLHVSAACGKSSREKRENRENGFYAKINEHQDFKREGMKKGGE